MKHRSHISNLRCATSTANNQVHKGAAGRSAAASSCLSSWSVPKYIRICSFQMLLSTLVEHSFTLTKSNSLKSAAGHPPAAPCQKESLTFSEIAACSKQGHSGIPHTWPFQFLQSCNFFLHLTALCQLGTIWDELPDQLRPCSMLVS